jgi:hypothetical protein
VAYETGQAHAGWGRRPGKHLVRGVPQFPADQVPLPLQDSQKGRVLVPVMSGFGDPEAHTVCRPSAVPFAIVGMRDQLGDLNRETALIVVSYLAVSCPCLPGPVQDLAGWCGSFATKPIAKAGKKASNGNGPERLKGS